MLSRSSIKGKNMETEIELKFFVSPDFSTTLVAKIAEEKVLQHSCRELGNTYFDTTENWLRQHDIGLRIRRYDDVFVQTVKTAGRVVAGLHQRPEYNAEHSNNIPDLFLHPSDIWPIGKEVGVLQQEINPIFSTDFNREQWLISMSDGSQVEVAFDQGWVSSGDRKEEICEVELELISGQTDALFNLARVLCGDGGMRLGNLSKAARGYRLAYDYPGDKTKPLTLVPTEKSHNAEYCFIQSLEHALAHWHHHEQIFVERDEFTALHEIAHAIGFIRQTLSVFGGIVPSRASAFLWQELMWLEEELSWLKECDYLDELTDDKGHAMRKLDARKWLVEQLNAQLKVLPNRENTLQLFSSSRYTRLLLDLSRWILTRGWRPFLDDKSRAKMAQDIRVFSVKQLDKTWAELVEAFPLERPLSRQDYIDQQHRLSRNLYTGICFASLYNEEERSAFRLPWEDLKKGIDDLLMLEPLHKLLPNLQGEEQAQLERWLSRQEHSILYAMEQTRKMSIDTLPYWQ